LKNQLAQEAEIAAMIALKQYFEDQKIVRLPNYLINKFFTT
jgi:propionyl-CoA carboxylase alpha chain